MPDQIMIEVSYALPEKQIIIPIRAPKDITVKEAIERSGILKEFDGINLEESHVGILGKPPLSTIHSETKIASKFIDH